MYAKTLIGFTAAAALVASTPIAAGTTDSATSSQLDTTGFLEPHTTYSQGKHAICVSGIVPVQAATNANVHLKIPANLTAEQTTQIIVNLTSANAQTFLTSITGDQATVGGTWNISSRLCFPASAVGQSRSSRQVQLLTHGIAFDQSYWDFSVPSNSFGNYSYVDYAAQKNQITFTYDRLGVGSSSHPDPVQVVQAALETEILHGLATMLRSGKLGNIKFDSVVGIGHSYGSDLTQAVAKQYPADFNAVVLTGLSSGKPGGPQFTSALNLLPASKLWSAGYLIPSTLFGVQYSFFSYPDLESGVVAAAYKTVETTTLGEQTTMAFFQKPAQNFTRPVYVVDGEKDLIFCNANCRTTDSQGRDIPAATLATLFPVANTNRSGTYILEGAGHGLGLAKNAGVASVKISDWIAKL